jgi:hypothetical protein
MEQRYFERWYVLKNLGSERAMCICECGKIKLVNIHNLLRGKSKSCGCLRAEQAVRRFTKHGHSKRGICFPEHQCWKNMKSRCLNPKDKRFADYGGRGIAVCDRWVDSFDAFMLDMGPRPDGHSIERVDNDKGYCPENCLWADRKTQMNNRSACVYISFCGETLTVAQWSEKLGVKPSTIRVRLKRGWSTERALAEHVHVKQKI